jgi:hypothetical protein
VRRRRRRKKKKKKKKKKRGHNDGIAALTEWCLTENSYCVSHGPQVFCSRRDPSHLKPHPR